MTTEVIAERVIWPSRKTPSNLQNEVLCHELKYALVIGHAENTKSIMIPVMSSNYYDFNGFSILNQRIIQILSEN